MSREDLATLSLILSFANFVLTWGVALYMYLSNKNKATNSRIDLVMKDLNEVIKEHGNRLTKLEGGPSHQDLGQWHEKTNQLGTSLAQLTGTVNGMNRLLTSIDEHLRSKTR